MRNSMIALASALALVGCDSGAEINGRAAQSADASVPLKGGIGQLKITAIDFGDMDQVKEIARGLGADGPAFMSYVISRAEAKATLSQPEIARADGAPPRRSRKPSSLRRRFGPGARLRAANNRR